MDMFSIINGGLFATFIICAMTLIIFSLKRARATRETNIYLALIVCAMIELVLQIACQFMSRTDGYDGFLARTIYELYVVAVFAFGVIFNLYVFAISLRTKNYKLWFRVSVSAIVAFLIYTFIIGIQVFKSDDVAYTYGGAIDYGLIPLTIALYVLWVIIMIRKHHRLTNRKFVPLVVMVVSVMLFSLAQVVDRTILITSFLHAFIVIMMLNTIENPDAKVLEQREREKHELERISAGKDSFISLASHQLRTPLTTIHGTASMLEDGDYGALSDRQAKALGMISINTDRMVSLVDDLLNVSRIQAGKFIIINEPTDLPEMVRRQLQTLTTIAHGRDIKLSLHPIDKNFPIINADNIKLYEVIGNFIDNAIFYSRAGSTVEIYLIHDKENNNVEFRVRDHGIGVPKSDQKKLFHEFYRTDNAKNVRPDGTGVGLFLAKQVVNGHGGQIIFESIENKGSTFGFRLPIR